MKSLLPIILVILALVGAIVFSLTKSSLPARQENRFGIAPNELESSPITGEKTNKLVFGTTTTTPSPTATPKVTLSPTPTPSLSQITVLPGTTENTDITKGGTESTKTTKMTKTTVCTPVYGQANTCTEHIVVDTGAEDAIFFNLAGLSYLGGLAAFVKAKSSK